MKKQFNYTVTQDGHMPAETREELRKIHLANIGKQIRLGITNEKKRSLSQNSYFHLINKMIADFLRAQAKDQGNELYYEINEETTKLWIKQKFLGYEEIDGERHLRHTSKLKTFEMNELWENLQIYFAPRGLNIPDPKQYGSHE